MNLRPAVNAGSEVDLAALLDELSIVMAPSLEEENVLAQWNTDSALPLVWADRSSLMQVFLNVITNSIRALSKQENRALSVAARAEGTRVLVEFTDTGGGVAHPEHLFRPFQEGADSSGLGLYLSRAFLRSFGGEIRYQPVDGGSCFSVSLNQADTSAQDPE